MILQHQFATNTFRGNKMKISTIAITVALTLSSLSSMASNVVFKPINESFATKACHVAATEGMGAAKKLVLAENIDFYAFKSSVKCNNITMTQFANKYAEKTTAESIQVSKPVITLVAKTDTIASQVCLDSLVIGENEARKKYNMLNDTIICNNKQLKTFVRKYKKQNVVVRNNAD